MKQYKHCSLIFLLSSLSCQTRHASERTDTLKERTIVRLNNQIELAPPKNSQIKLGKIKRSFIEITPIQQKEFEILYTPTPRSFREFQTYRKHLDTYLSEISKSPLESIQLSWPLKEGRITSFYGLRKNRFHAGVDIAAPIGTPVYASGSGLVLLVRGRHNLPGYGNVVVIGHSSGIQTIYAHLKRVMVVEGQVVQVGEQIGEVGSTGRSTGPHLHFETRLSKAGVAVDPLEFLKPSVQETQKKKNQRVADILQNSQTIDHLIANSLH